MLGLKNQLFIDRRVYDRKGKWLKPKDDTYTNLFYFFSQKPTLVPTFENGYEQIKAEAKVVVAGEHPICSGDIFILDTGERLQVITITRNYFEPNVEVKDLLKPRVLSMELTLE